MVTAALIFPYNKLGNIIGTQSIQFQYFSARFDKTEQNYFNLAQKSNNKVYGYIRVELSHKASNEESLIDTYIELIEKEKELFSPEAAYLAGQKASQAERKYYPLEYIGSVILEHDNQSLLGERDSMYNSLCDLLGEPHLMDEFNELFRYCHGEINWIIEQFYHWGYYGNIPDIKAIAR